MKINKDEKFLAQTCAEVPKEEFDKIARLLRQEMLIRHKQAVGLAANQISFPIRAFAMKRQKRTGVYVFINPTIISKAGLVIQHKEKCLSLKKEFKVPRNTFITVTDEYYCKGEHIELIGQDAIVFQHEFDHINGITIKTRSKDGK